MDHGKASRPLDAKRIVVTSLAICLALVAVLHVALLSTDSEDYRQWVHVQMALLAGCAILLLWSRGSRPGWLAAAVVLAVPAIYINARYTNYGGGVLVWLLPTLVAAAVAALAWRQWHRRPSAGRNPDARHDSPGAN